MKEDQRGKHGRQGRKPTGRKRDTPLSTKLTREEFAEVVEKSVEISAGMADTIMKGIRKLKGES